MNSGFLFLTVATGILGIVDFIALCIAVSDRQQDRASFLMVILIILVLTFLTSGFLGFSG